MRNARLALVRSLVVAVVSALCVAASSPPSSAEPTWLSSVDVGAEAVAVSGADVDHLPDDTAAVVWSAEDEEGIGTVRLATRALGDEAFSSTEPISEGDARSPQVVVDEQGTVTVAWIQEGGDDTVQVTRLDAGATEWSSPQVVADHSTAEFQLLVDPAGRVTVVSSHAVHDPDAGSSLYRVDANTLPPGGSWSGAQEVAGDTLQAIAELQAVVDVSGTVTAVWTQDFQTSTSHVHVASADVGGGFVAAPLGPVGGHAPDLAATPGGGVAVSWAEPGPGGQFAVASTRAPGGSFTVPEATSNGPQHQVIDTEIVVDSAATTVLFAATTFDEYVVVASTRPLGESFTPQLLAYDDPGVVLAALQVAAAPDGALTALWQRGDGPGLVTGVQGAYRAAGGEFTTFDAEIGDDVDHSTLAPAAAVDSAGDATVLWERVNPGTGSTLRSRVLDATGPRVVMTVPGTALPGSVVPMTATATESWSRPATLTWDFGDGATSTGAATSHVYAAGTYQVSVTATDGIGNTTTRTRSLVVAVPPLAPLPPPPPTPTPSDRVAPVLSKARVSPKTLPADRPARVRVTSSEAAALVAVVQCRTEGRWKRLVRKRWSIERGANTEKLFGKAAQRRLDSGTCRARLNATDPAGNVSATVTTGFRVARG